jgi:hypothetical protein
MANIALNKDEASKEEAQESLMEHIADNWTGPFWVNFFSGDSGAGIQAVVEVEDTSLNLDADFRAKFPFKWKGWLLIVLKVPFGYIEFLKDK